MKKEEIEFHETASIFPLMEGKEFDDLKEDIKKNGLLEPILLYKEQIIDGRNRFRACKDLEIEPRFRARQRGGNRPGPTRSLQCPHSAAGRDRSYRQFGCPSCDGHVRQPLARHRRDTARWAIRCHTGLRP